MTSTNLCLGMRKRKREEKNRVGWNTGGDVRAAGLVGGGVENDKKKCALRYNLLLWSCCKKRICTNSN